MLHRFFSLTFLFLTYTTCVQATAFPKYKEVVETLIRTTEVCEISFQSGTKLSLEKRVDGYWVGLAIWDFTALRYDISQKQLFWMAEAQEYNTVQFKNNDVINTLISKNDLITPYTVIQEQDPYNVHPFFGYDGWYHDVIKKYDQLEQTQSLKDFELYALARAYSNYAKILLSDPGGVYYALSDDFLTTEKATLEQINLYYTNANKAIDYFHKTYLKNPNWSTIVGNIFTKYSNEVVTHYHTLALHVKHKDALKVLKGKELYTKETLAFVANTLRSCPENAILWTYGDNTSLPMFYLQQIEGLRTDVLVTDAYQLSLWRYVEYLKNKQIHSNPIVLELDVAIYHKNTNDYIILKDKEENLSITDLEIALTNEEKYKRFETKNISFPFNKQETLSIDLNNKYLIKSEWLSLFIMAQNQRPLCFLYDFKEGNLTFAQSLGIKKYLHPIGSIYQLDNDEYTIASDEEIEANYQIMTKKLKWFPIKEIKKENHSPFSQYLWSTIVLANELQNSGKNAQVVYLLDDFKKTFPLNPTTTTFNGLFYFIALYFKADVPTKAEILITEYFQVLLSKETLNKDEYNFVQRVDNILQERKIDKFNKTIQQLYLKFQ